MPNILDKFKKPQSPTQPPKPITGQPSLVPKPPNQPQPPENPQPQPTPEPQPEPQPTTEPLPNPESAGEWNAAKNYDENSSPGVDSSNKATKTSHFPLNKLISLPSPISPNIKILANLRRALLTITNVFETLYLFIRSKKIYTIAVIALILLATTISSFILFYTPESTPTTTLTQVTPAPTTPSATTSTQVGFTVPTIAFDPNSGYVPPKINPPPDEIFIGEQMIKLKSTIGTNHVARVTRIQTDQVQLIYIRAFLPNLAFGAHYQLWAQNQHQTKSIGKLTKEETDTFTLESQQPQLPQVYQDMLNTFIVSEETDRDNQIGQIILQGNF